MVDDFQHQNYPNRVAEDGGFKGKTIFITGGTGFVGKALVEKLLRTCPTINKIYMMIRPKKKESVQKRLIATFQNPIFDKLRRQRGTEIFQKVLAIPGDLTEPDLKISNEDRQLLIAEVQIVFHLAATVRFDEPFKKAIIFNTRGTKLLLELAKECKHLLAFSHCSTAFCFPAEDVLDEKPYSPPTDPNVVLHICETMNDEVVERIGKILIDGHPNTYTYSKALAEGLVNQEMDNLPVIIFRPSIVLPSWKDPISGWVEGFGGPVGLIVDVGRGLLKTTNTSVQRCNNIVPVDIAINVMIWGTYSSMQLGKQQIVYNVTSRLQVQLKEAFEKAAQMLQYEMPLGAIVSYPRLYYGNSRLVHTILLFLLQYFPAVLYDLAACLLHRKPKVWRLQTKALRRFEMVRYFVNRNWEFLTKRLKEDSEKMNITEAELYGIDLKEIDLKSYLHSMLHGIRFYVLQENDDSISKVRRHLKLMWTIEVTTTIVVLLFVAVLITCFLFVFVINVPNI